MPVGQLNLLLFLFRLAASCCICSTGRAASQRNYGRLYDSLPNMACDPMLCLVMMRSGLGQPTGAIRVISGGRRQPVGSRSSRVKSIIGRWPVSEHLGAARLSKTLAYQL